jgi:LacI family transcriptional regulator
MEMIRDEANEARHHGPMQPIPRVALLVETSNGYARELLRGIKSYVKEHSPWSLSLAEKGRGEVVPGWLEGWKGQGIIARVENVRIAKAILATNIPAVDVSFGLEQSPFPRVVTDSLETTRLAAEHLLERGFTHFGYCGDNYYHWSRLRSGLFEGHVRRAGHTCHVFDGVRRVPGGTCWDAEVESIAAWLRTLPRPTGIMACYDIRGQQVLEACRSLGAEVPDEVSVIGVHNDELLCELCDPPLSSVIPNARRAGYEAASLLHRMMTGETIALQRVLIPPVGIAARQSTDVVAVSDPLLSRAVRFIREHACENIGVKDILRAVPMSRKALERGFRQVLARTPHDQILRVKIVRAKSLLATTELTLAQIADRCGFENPEYFSVAFKRLAGDTPARFRIKHKA